MIQAFAPRNPRGYSWVLLLIAVLFAWTDVADAQGRRARPKAKTESSQPKDDAMKDEDEPKGKAGDQDKDDAPKDKNDAPKKEGAPAPEAAERKKEPGVEVFKDPRAEAILQKRFPSVGRLPDPRAKKSVLNMVAGAETVDRDVITRFVDGATYMLTNPANVAAMVNGAGGANRALEIETATDDLLEVLHKAQAARNAGFLTEYNRILIPRLKKLLSNNLFARIEAMIILGQIGSNDLVPDFVTQLNDPNQTVWVKLWAARGITSVSGGGTRDLGGGKGDSAAKALADWLEKEKDLPWFAQMRALEALGALRQAKTALKADQPEFANVAMKFLSDPETRLEVRAMAAWALGMMRIDSALNKFNFALVAYNIGEVAAELGDKVDDVFEANSYQSRYYTSFLLHQIYPALIGDPKIRDSGILKVPGNLSGHAQAKPFLQQVDNQVKPVVTSAVEMLNAPRGKQKELQKELGERVAALRAFLGKNPPNAVAAAPKGK